jgi:hypothetical protein
MNMWRGAVAVLLGIVSGLLAADPPQDPLSLLDQRVAATQAAATAPELFLSPSTMGAPSNDLEAAITKGLIYLEGAQHDNGSFDRLQSVRPPNADQQAIAHGSAFMKDPILMSDGPDKDAAEPDTEQIADTCLAAETMMLAVNSGRRPELSPKCLKAIDFLCKQIKTWEGDTIYIQKRTLDPLHDPRPLEDEHNLNLSKDVRFYNSTVDTFFALRFLVEARDRVDDPARRSRVQSALDILMSKIIKCQDVSGTWLDKADPDASFPFHHNPDTVHFIFQPVPPYDPNVDNLTSHCTAVSAINVAARHGIPIPAEVRYRAENYLHNALQLRKLHAGTTEECIRIMVIVAAETEIYETCRAALQQGLDDLAQHKDISIDQIDALRTHATQAKKDLLAGVPYVFDIGRFPTIGPAIDALPEILTGMRIISDENVHTELARTCNAFIHKQLADGSISAVPTGVLARDDCVYGTATSLRFMMMASNMKETSNAATQH